MESKEQVSNIKSGKTSFDWHFENKTDVVESFQHHWEFDNGLISALNNEPKLSLNFSGFGLNSSNHDLLVLDSTDPMSGYLVLEFKTEIKEQFRYYSHHISLTGKKLEIPLNFTWRGENSDKSQIIKATWGTAKGKVSSLVLNFRDTPPDFQLRRVHMPLNESAITSPEYSELNCNGTSFAPSTQPQLWRLNEPCWTPSQYMWLLNRLHSESPRQVLDLQNKTSWFESGAHNVSHSYSSIWLLNASIYLIVIMGLIYAFWLRYRFQSQYKSPSMPWYRWIINKVLFRKMAFPYHLLISYSAILIPTLFLGGFMVILKWPSDTVLLDWPKYFLWALLQQFVLGYVLAERIFNNVMKNKLLASVLAGFVFCLFHLPSVTLMWATFLAGSCWAFGWLLFRRFIPLAISHATLALLFYNTMPEKYLYSAKVLQWFWK